MPTPQEEAVACQARDYYSRHLQADLELSHPREYIAIEPQSGEYFLASSLSAAIQAARRAHPDRLSFGLRIGAATAVHLGVLDS